MPGCNRAARSCDLDHTTPWPHGSTEPTNLGPLCRRHHNLKTHRGWHLHATGDPTNPNDPLTYTWRSPAGITTTDHPPPPLNPPPEPERPPPF